MWRGRGGHQDYLCKTSVRCSDFISTCFCRQSTGCSLHIHLFGSSLIATCGGDVLSPFPIHFVAGSQLQAMEHDPPTHPNSLPPDP